MLIFDDKLIYMDFFLPAAKVPRLQTTMQVVGNPMWLKRAALKYFQSKAVACFVACYVLEGEHIAD